MAGLLRKKIIVRNYNEEIYSKETFGLEEEILLLRVPVDEKIRLSHVVPAVLFMPEEKDTMDVCICKSFGVCSEDKSLGWMACNVCCLWAHIVLAQDRTVLSAIKRDFKCGCDRILPFLLKQYCIYSHIIQVSAIRMSIKELLPNLLSTKIIDLVLCPEVLIHMIADLECFFHLVAEVIIQDSYIHKISS